MLAELGIGEERAAPDDVNVLRHVRSSTEKRAAEEIADRKSCADFDQFQPLFEQVDRDLKSGHRMTQRFGRNTSIARTPGGHSKCSTDGHPNCSTLAVVI